MQVDVESCCGSIYLPNPSRLHTASNKYPLYYRLEHFSENNTLSKKSTSKSQHCLEDIIA